MSRRRSWCSSGTSTSRSRTAVCRITSAGFIPDRDSLLLQTPESLAKSLALDVRTGQDVIRIDRGAREVEVRDLAQGRTYRESYDKLVLCPGAGPAADPGSG